MFIFNLTYIILHNEDDVNSKIIIIEDIFIFSVDFRFRLWYNTIRGEGFILNLTEHIRIMLVKSNNIPEAELARRVGMTPQNLNRKLKAENYTVKDLARIAEALDCELSIKFLRKRDGVEL